jgi:hypothetical protein
VRAISAWPMSSALGHGEIEARRRNAAGVRLITDLKKRELKTGEVEHADDAQNRDTN